jgi:hypothetical protein
VSLHIRGRGALDAPGKIVATLLAAVESMTGVACDDYTAAIVAAARQAGDLT